MTLKFDECKNIAADLKKIDTTRSTVFDSSVKAFMVKDDDVEAMNEAHIKQVISTDIRDAVLGEARIIAASEPTFTVPFESNEQDAQDASSRIEQICGAIHQGNVRVKGRSYLYEAVKSAAIYDEVNIAIKPVQDLIDNATPENKPRFEAIAQMTPVIFQVLPPKLCYPYFDIAGLQYHYTERKVTAGQVASLWGKDADKAVKGLVLSQQVDYSEFYSPDTYSVWANGTEIKTDQNRYGFIPVVSAIVEGSDLFADESMDTRQPLGYGAIKSGMFATQNMALTAMRSQAFAIAANGQLVYKANAPGKSLDVDYSIPGGVTTIEQGEELGPLSKNVIDPSLQYLYQVATKGVEGSTIYRQTLGQPLEGGGNAPYSMVALLNQTGRLPLTQLLGVLSSLFAQMYTYAIQMCRINGGIKIGSKITGKSSSGAVLSMDKAEIPERIDIQVKLDAKLPQDERLNVQTAQAATSGDQPMMSISTARERYLGIGQSDLEDQKIVKEKASWLTVQQTFAAQAQATMSQTQLPPQQGQATQSMSPDQAAQLQQMMSQNAQPGLPQAGPAPVPGTPQEQLPAGGGL